MVLLLKLQLAFEISVAVSKLRNVLLPEFQFQVPRLNLWVIEGAYSMACVSAVWCNGVSEQDRGN